MTALRSIFDGFLGRHHRLMLAVALVLTASQAHAQNTHSAQLIRAQQQYFTAADSPSLNFGSGSFTVEAWVKADAGSANSLGYTMVFKTAPGDDAYGIVLENGGYLYGRVGGAHVSNETAGHADNVYNSTQLDDGLWHHVAFSYDQVTLRIYLDGALVADRVATGQDASCAGPLTIGGTSPYFYSGSIDEVRIWSGARTQAEIQGARFTELVGNEPGLQTYWKLNNSTSDSTALGHNLTSFNNPLFSSASLPFVGQSTFPIAGLITHYAFENNLEDASGNANHGTASGAVAFAVGKVGNGLLFNGGYVDGLPDAYLPEVTAACWVRVDAGQTGERSLIDGWKGRENYRLWIENQSGQLRIRAAFHEAVSATEGYPEVSATSTSVLPTVTWMHVALTFGADHVLRLYVNGAEEASAPRSGSPYTGGATPPTDLRLGIDRNGGSIFQGLLDDVRIYNRALTAQEMAGFASPSNPGEVAFDVYNQTFPSSDTRAQPEWGGATSGGNAGSEFFLGPRQDGTTRLTLTNLPNHTKLRARFNVVIFGTWLGNSVPDLWSWGLRNEAPFLSTTFAQDSMGPQAYPGTYPGNSNAPRSGAVATGVYSTGTTNTSYFLEQTFDHTGSTLELDFTLANSTREWGLDNVSISVVTQPGPVDVGGTVTPPAPTGEPVFVTLTGNNQTLTTQAAVDGSYNFPGLVQSSAPYQLSAFVDSNSNGVLDGGEPKMNYSGNPFFVITEVTNADMIFPSAVPINSGLLGHWKLDEASGGVANDSSGNGRHGQLTGGTWNTLDGRKSLVFDGDSADFLSIPHDPAFAQPAFTLTGWIRFRNYVNQAWASKGDFMQVWQNGALTYVSVNNSISISSGPILKDEWHHVAVVVGPQYQEIYLDGTRRNEAAGVSLPVNSLPLVFGGTQAGDSGWFWNGELSDLRYYNRALSAEEAMGTFNAGGVSGVVIYSGHLGGAVRVQAKAAGTTLEASFPLAGQYQFPDLLGGFAYAITAFLDMNGNGQRDTWEPSGSPAGSPLPINATFLTNKDIALTNAPDTDNDGIADSYENAHGLTVGVNDALLDLDGDNLSNLREFLAGLKANVGDTDGDTTGDAVELQQNGTFAHSNDSDHDGMTDAFEVANNLNPYNVGDAAFDYDGDGLSNLEEFTASLNPRQRDSNTDGMSDYQQVKGGKFNRYYYDRTNRLIGATYDNGTWMGWKYDGNSNIARQVVFTVFDADNDGLPDVWELQNGFSFASGNGSNGANADNDNDGWSNYQEYLAGTNPNDPLSVPVLTVGTNSAAFQTPPLIRFIQPPATGGAHAILKTRLWDNESNPAAVKVQYFETSTSEWKDATLLKLDNQPVTPTTKATSSQAGTNHDLLWDALTDLGPAHNAVTYLRTWGQDFSTGETSETVPYALNTAGDFDGDGIPDTYEIANGLDPNSSTGIDGTTGDSDHDGFNNFAEFAFHMNLGQSDITNGPGMSSAVNPADGKTYHTYSYRRRLDAAALNMTYTVQTSTDLSLWTSDIADIEPISTTPTGDGVTETVTVRIKPPLDTPNMKKFVRVQVTK